MSTKPGDEKATHPELAVPGKGDQYSKASEDNRALGENIGGITGAHKIVTGETAPEVSQGAWRERVFTPRATMGRDEMRAALRTSLEASTGAGAAAAGAFELLRSQWLPILRQAMEQAGGDGLDAWLLTVLKPPGRVATAPLLGELISAFAKMRGAASIDELSGHARAVIDAVDRATAKPRRVSFKQMERELEGKVEVHELLLILFCDESELHSRLEEVGSTLETLRAQLKSMPGTNPDGMYSNFARLKAEARVLSAELTRRGRSPK